MESDAATINPFVLRRLRVIGANAAFVYLYLLRIAPEQGEWFVCSVKRLVDEIGMGPMPVRKALRNLEDLDIIFVDRASNASTETRVMLREWVVDKSPTQAVDNVKKLCQVDNLLSHEMNSAPPKGFQLFPTEDAPKPQVRASLSHEMNSAPENGAYVLSLDLSGLGGSEEGGEEIGDIGFDEFWSLVPRKIAKRDALESFVKALAKADLATIINGMKRYAEYIERPDAPTACHPTTWLNQERWTDVYPAPKNTNTFAAARGAATYENC